MLMDEAVQAIGSSSQDLVDVADGCRNRVGGGRCRLTKEGAVEIAPLRVAPEVTAPA